MQMDKVTILSEKAFHDYVPQKSQNENAAIRIGDNIIAKDSTAIRYLDTMYLSFYDVKNYADEINRNTPLGSNRLTSKDKVKIDTFIDKYSDKFFTVHCQTGVSRSAAIGYYILERLGYTEELNRKKNSALYLPNIEAYGILIGKPYTRATAIYLKKKLTQIEE